MVIICTKVFEQLDQETNKIQSANVYNEEFQNASIYDTNLLKDVQ